MTAEVPETPGAEVSAEASEPRPATAGQTLRAAREAAGLTVTDVASSLKFSVRQVELLEADDYASLPGNTVVRGFARSYARLLGLDADGLVGLLNVRTPSEMADVRPPDNMGVAAEAGVRQISPMAAAAIVVTLAAFLLGMWHFFGPRPVRSDVTVKAASQPMVQPQPVPLQPAADAPAAAPIDGATPAPAPASVAETSGPVLNFVFEGRSWVEVADATKQTVHSAENPAGSKLTLTGKPPFEIVVGNAGKVRLNYDGREIDLVPHTRAEVARLKLD